MSWVQRIFSRDDTEQNSSPSQMGIRYDQSLIPQLKKEHEDLLRLYSAIGVLTSSDQWTDVPHALQEFRTQLEVHLLTENVRFYNYILQNTQSDDEVLVIIKRFRRDMNVIARAVVTFVKKYQLDAFTAEDKEHFQREYFQIASSLKKRIEREEEHLYTLYKPN